MTRIALLFILIIAIGCKTNRIVDKQRQGLWIEKKSLNDIAYKSKGRYDKGSPVKTWKYFENGKLAKKEVYKDSICKTTFYHPNGKVMLAGQTKIREENRDLHWFYYGDWQEFDTSGKLISIRTYKDGEMVSETEVN